MIFFTSFCWFLDFLLEILKSKRKIWRCPPERLDKYKNAVWPKYYFQKKNSKYEILNHFYFGSNFVSFFGTALGRFSQCFFFTQRPPPPPSPPRPSPTSCYNFLLTVILKTFANFANFKLIHESFISQNKQLNSSRGHHLRKFIKWKISSNSIAKILKLNTDQYFVWVIMNHITE